MNRLSWTVSGKVNFLAMFDSETNLESESISFEFKPELEVGGHCEIITMISVLAEF